MRMSKEEREFRERVDWILDEYADYLSSDDDDPKPSLPIRTELLVDKDKQAGVAFAIDDDDHHRKEEENQEEYSMKMKMKMKKSSEDKIPSAIVDHCYQRYYFNSSSSSSKTTQNNLVTHNNSQTTTSSTGRIVTDHDDDKQNMRDSTTKFEQLGGSNQISLKFIPPKKRILSEYYQEEGEAAMHNNKIKKMKNEETSCCRSANPPPELQRKFIYIKNKAWGSSFMHFFVKQNNFVQAEKPMKKTDEKISSRDSPANQPPPLPQKYKEKVNAMGGSEPVLVIQKRLFKSDRTQQLNRFLIPHRQMRAQFLTDEEKENVKKNQLEVTLIDPRLKEWTLNVKEWNMNSSVYVLITNWYKLVVENEKDLKEGTEVQLWSFRVGTRLCFVLVRLD
ncbi:hypothetical protein LguiA_036569 [Lonicera macranthoides]